MLTVLSGWPSPAPEVQPFDLSVITCASTGGEPCGGFGLETGAEVEVAGDDTVSGKQPLSGTVLLLQLLQVMSRFGPNTSIQTPIASNITRSPPSVPGVESSPYFMASEATFGSGALHALAPAMSSAIRSSLAGLDGTQRGVGEFFAVSPSVC